MLTKIKHLSVAQEAIDFQDEKFFKELVLVYTPYVTGSVPKNQEAAALAKAVAAVINKFIDGNVTVQLNHYPTCIWTPLLDASNPMTALWSEYIRNEDGLDMIKKAGGSLKAGVDLKKSKLLGAFTKVSAKINIDLDHFKPGIARLTAEELAAITLHEVGHLFTYLEMMDRTMSANLVLTGLDKVLRSGADVARREMTIEAAGKAAGLEKKVIEDLKKSGADSAVTTVILTEYSKSLKSSNGNNFYDYNSWEMAADQFAQRHGAGRHIVTALDKLFTAYGAEALRGNIAYLFGEAVKMVQALFIAGGSVLTAIGTGPIGLFFMFLGFGLVYLMASSDHERDGAPVYDKPLERAQRVRRQFVERTKNPNLPKAVVEQILQDVAVIDQTVANYASRKGWMETIWNVFSSARHDSVKYQQELEKLAMNDLFLRAADLKHL